MGVPSSCGAEAPLPCHGQGLAGVRVRRRLFRVGAGQGPLIDGRGIGQVEPGALQSLLGQDLLVEPTQGNPVFGLGGLLRTLVSEVEDIPKLGAARDEQRPGENRICGEVQPAQ